MLGRSVKGSNSGLLRAYLPSRRSFKTCQGVFSPSYTINSVGAVGGDVFMDASRRLWPSYTSLLCEGGPSRVYGCFKASLILDILVLVYGRG